MTFPVVGMVGGGQLARMSGQAATSLAVRFRVLVESPDDSAAQVVPDAVVGDYRDLATLQGFAAGCDVVTFDHEHVPTASLEALQAAGVAVHPGPHALVHAQDKAVMRARLADIGAPCPRWRPVATAGELADFGDEVGWPVIVKATRGGYDGKGVRLVEDAAAAGPVVAGAAGRGVELLAEERVAFTRELAAMVARSPHGQAVAYPVVETVQVDGICREVIAPARIADEHAVTAQQVALTLADQLGVTGVLAVELFDTPAGVLVNELAMRPHNSGHWSIDGAVTSQFEQHLRAVLDLPLGDPRMIAPYAVMANVLGGDQPDMYGAYLHVMAHDPGIRVHMYGKDVKPGRKIGHVTAIGDDLEDLLERARHAADFLRGDVTE